MPSIIINDKIYLCEAWILTSRHVILIVTPELEFWGTSLRWAQNFGAIAFEKIEPFQDNFIFLGTCLHWILIIFSQVLADRTVVL